MGHYLTDYLCKNCQQLHCTCTRTPSAAQVAFEQKFVVLKDFTVMRVEDLKQNFSRTYLMGLHHRPVYDTREDALLQARKLSQDNIAGLYEAYTAAVAKHERQFAEDLKRIE